jgi:hypothetical protein
VASRDQGKLFGFSNQKEVGMLSPSKPLLLRFSVGRLIELSSTAALLALSSVTVAMAQLDSGQIFGCVRGRSKAVIADATVTVTNQGNGERRHTGKTGDARQIQLALKYIF